MVDIELLDPRTPRASTGFGAEKDWEQTLAMQKQYRDIKTDQPLDRLPHQRFPAASDR